MDHRRRVGATILIGSTLVVSSTLVVCRIQLTTKKPTVYFPQVLLDEDATIVVVELPAALAFEELLDSPTFESGGNPSGSAPCIEDALDE